MKTNTNLSDMPLNQLENEKLQKEALKSVKSLRPMKSVTRAKSLRPNQLQTAVVARMRKHPVKLQ